MFGPSSDGALTVRQLEALDRIADREPGAVVFARLGGDVLVRYPSGAQRRVTPKGRIS